ncbi:MAG: DNA-binding response regulator, LuxR family, partial [Proteobacteria bacterium]|nr:DNA-binding response regulator, LuxR family [Pseudomonadota bacterium]
MSGKTRVMLVDDHAVVRMGFRMLLEATDDMTVVAEAETGEAAYQSFQDAAPDVIVMDLAMPGAGGMEAAKRILARDKGARILALSAHEDPSHARHMLKAGALGYLCKRSAPEALIDAIRQIAAGRMYVDAIVAQRMAMQEFRGETNPVGLLSEREFEIFLKLAKGLSVNQIADILTLSPRTVGTHLYNIKQKLNVSNQAE